MENKKTIHFPGLNNLRLLAALSVLVFHVEDKKLLLGFENRWLANLTIVGDLGVTLFFVLSGFLITYLLLAERQSTHTVRIKKFYMRRILRIWPLYYLILVLGFFVLPHIGLFQLPTTGLIDPTNLTQLLLFFLFFANIGFVRYGNLPYVDQTWSVAAEEQFYLLWPLIIKHIRNIMPVLLLVLIVFAGGRAYMGSMHQQGIIYRKAYALLYYARIDNMAVGGIFAWLYFNKSTVINVLCNRWLQVANGLLLVLLWWSGTVVPYIHHVLYAAMFGIVILNAANGTAWVAIKSKALHYLGKISYGIYMYHNIAIVVTLKLCAQVLPTSSVLYFVATHVVSIALSLLLAHVSFRYFEKYFLRLKAKFTVVPSAD